MIIGIVKLSPKYTIIFLINKSLHTSLSNLM